MAKYPVEAEKRLSESSIWNIQQNYFNHKGVDAWNDEIPFFISSNAFIANRYAHLCIQYVLDKLTDQKPLYLVEVGAGPGKFSFYFLRAFEQSLKDRNLKVDYQYILTDVATKNVEFCRENVALQSLIKQNKLDFALFDAAVDDDFTCLNSGVKFSELASGGHAIFICNYVFDVIAQDFFQYENEQLSDIHMTLQSRYEKFDKKNPTNLRELSIKYSSYPIQTKNYYQDPDLNQLLYTYPEYFPNQQKGNFLFPVGAMQFCDRMKKICDKYLIICGDIGHVTLDELANLNPKNCHSFEGCYCYMMNFHALGEYLKAKGGDALLTKHRNSYKVSLYTHGQTLEEAPNTKAYFLNEMESMGADEFCYLNDEFALNNYRYSMKSCLSFLRLSCYEPDTYFHMHDKLIDELSVLGEGLAADIKVALMQVEKNLYHYQSFYDVFSLLGMLHLKLKQYDKAEKLFKQALKYGKSPFVPLRSLGLLFDEKGNSNKAINFYRKALAYNKKDYLCKTRISMLEGSPALLIKPIVKALFVFGASLALIYLALFK